MVRLSCLVGFAFAVTFSQIQAENSQDRHDTATEQIGTQQKAEGAEAKQASSTEKLTAKEEIRLWPCEKKLIDLTNAQRRRYGLADLTIDKDLLASTRAHCYWMADVRSLQHTTAMVAENIAMGQRSCDEAVSSWMASPGHRANMLGSYSHIGMAAYQTSDGTIYWCLQFSP
jgi:uncharacterized protein YkwD